MKSLLAICLILAAPFVVAADKGAVAPAADDVVRGVVLEVKDVESYTYLRLKTKSGETWAAVEKTPLKKGAEVTIEHAMVMKNFESVALKRRFDSIVFGQLAGAAGVAPAAAPHGGMAKAPVNVANIKVDKAAGANARTVAEIIGRAGQLKDKPVLVRGQIVKYNAGIMGKNWLHLRDGTGSDKDGSNDLLVTTLNEASPGEVVTVKGTVRTDKDFGSGYVYKVMVDEATLQK
ncbi:MAG: nucleotide-binding protein [Betaproteobacteria bacterium HGW-Betaproteobacteria-7]|jgi:hypothetical protein|nr:MAG: nucleotide-binding protein [Betaproteobacteria bacterium HGW-Betaproteobacteria-7]